MYFCQLFSEWLNKSYYYYYYYYDGKTIWKLTKLKIVNFEMASSIFLNTYFEVNYLLSLSINHCLNNIFELWHIRSSCPKITFFEHSNFEFCISKQKILTIFEIPKNKKMHPWRSNECQRVSCEKCKTLNIFKNAGSHPINIVSTYLNRRSMLFFSLKRASW